MGAVGTYGFLNARVRALRSELLSRDVYRSLLSAEHLRDFLEALSHTHLAPLVERFGLHSPEALERELFYEEVRRLRNIERYAEGPPGRLLAVLLERYEIEKLKQLLRLWMQPQESGEEAIREKVIHEYSPDAILQAESIGDIVQVLKGTPYADLLERSIPDFRARKSVFPLELSLEKYVFGRLQEIGTSLPKTDGAIFRRLAGLEIDLKNLDWIHRFKTYYELSAAEIDTMLLSGGYRLAAKDIRNYLAGEHLAEIIVKLSRGRSVRFPGNLEGDIPFESLEFFYELLLFEEARRAFMAFPFSIGAVLGYFYLVRFEMRNLRILLEGKQYRLPPEEIESMLIW
ncbi:V-type ATPase subunit [bacterium]|nr:V-type ATPase subunit [bacterium]